MEEAAIDIFLPVMESAMVFAGHYAKVCGRDVVLSQDVSIGLMYAARNVTGKQIGSLFPEIYDEDDDSDDDLEECDDVDEDSWVRYSGNDEMANKMNECMDTWDAWEPTSPAENALKNAVQKASNY
jgi:hypothetical protein